MYSKLYYNQHVKPAVDSEIGDQKISHAERFTIVNKHLNQIYEAEPEEFKESICNVIDKECKAREAEKGISQSVIAGNKKMGLEEYLLYVLNSLVMGQRLICDCRAQSSFPNMVGDFLEAMVKRTGWSFTLIGGGPDIAMGGKVRTILLHTGQDLYGQTFAKAVPNYKEKMLVPYSKFLDTINCE